MIKYVFVDCDGSLTDGTQIWTQDGFFGRTYSVIDGKGFELLLKRGIGCAIISQSSGADIQARAKHLNIGCHTGVNDKRKLIQKIWPNRFHQIAFFGDDIGDAGIMKAVGAVGCPKNARPEIRDLVMSSKFFRPAFISSKRGGHGAFRDFVEYLIDNRYV